jgi:predicted Ser/Thr protein kinase
MLSTTTRLKRVKTQLEKLTKEEARLEKQAIKEAKTFREKLAIWVDSNHKEDRGSIISAEKYPKLRAYFNGNMERYRTYNLVDRFQEYIFAVLDGEPVDKDTEDCLKEMVKKNLGSFECDW